MFFSLDIANFMKIINISRDFLIVNVEQARIWPSQVTATKKPAKQLQTQRSLI